MRPKITRQYGIRWPTGVVFAYSSREDAEQALSDDGRGIGTLVVIEYVPGQPRSEEADWQDVQP